MTPRSSKTCFHDPPARDAAMSTKFNFVFYVTHKFACPVMKRRSKLLSLIGAGSCNEYKILAGHEVHQEKYSALCIERRFLGLSLCCSWRKSGRPTIRMKHNVRNWHNTAPRINISASATLIDARPQSVNELVTSVRVLEYDEPGDDMMEDSCRIL